MPHLQIRLFGTLRVVPAGATREAHLPGRLRDLLAYLVLRREQPQAREVLAGTFWGDQPDARARACLSTALWRLRRILAPGAGTEERYLVTGGRDEVRFVAGDACLVDVAEFERGVELPLAGEALTAEGARRVERALALYTGPLLEGVYHDWALRERERLRSLYLETLSRIMQHHARHGDLQRAISSGEQILRLDPLREEVHRDLIRLHLAGGQRALALRQYEACREELRRELEITPMEETEALLRIALHERGGYTRAPRAGDGPEPQAVLSLRAAMDDFDSAYRRLEVALKRIDPALLPHECRTDENPAHPASWEGRGSASGAAGPVAERPRP